MTDQPSQPDELVIELAGDEAPAPTDNVVLLLPGSGPAGRAIEQPLVVRLREALDASNEMIMVVEPSGRVLFANRTAIDQLGLEGDDATFPAVESLLGGRRRDDVWRALDDDHEWRGEVSATRPDGSTVHLELTMLADRSTTGDIRSLTVVAHDIGEQRALQHALEHRSTHDGLTGLANRQHLLREINAALPGLTERGQPGALLLIDIDEFRTVTNSLGHEAGDRVLVAYAYRLLRTFPADAILARVGGDEFAVFVPGADDIDALGEQLVGTTVAPFYIDGTEVHLSVGTGIALTGPHDPAPSAEALLRMADAASHRGKERGRGTIEVFEPQHQADAEDRLTAFQHLRRALRHDELGVHYQPKISLASGRIVGAEALMRWNAPGGRIRGPAAFLDVAEDSGLIIPMGRRLLDEVCRDATTLRQAGPGGEPLVLSVNLSVRQLEHPSLVDEVAEAVREAGVDPGLIELEITESALMEDVTTSAEILSRLKRLGTKIAVDDFGTGYSSLHYLQRLPVDVLKVDRSFVAGLQGSADDRAIVSAVIQLAQALRLTSVAEGVETADQLAQVRELGCGQAQGYHIARPMELDDLRELVASAPSW